MEQLLLCPGTEAAAGINHSTPVPSNTVVLQAVLPPPAAHQPHKPVDLGISTVAGDSLGDELPHELVRPQAQGGAHAGKLVDVLLTDNPK